MHTITKIKNSMKQDPNHVIIMHTVEVIIKVSVASLVSVALLQDTNQGLTLSGGIFFMLPSIQ